MVAMCLYFISLTDMVVFITTVCAFFIALGRLTGEVALFLLGLLFCNPFIRMRNQLLTPRS